MDHFSREKEFEVDLESGETTSEEENPKDIPASIQKGKVFNRSRSGFSTIDRVLQSEYGIGTDHASPTICQLDDDIDLLIDKLSDGEENREYAVLMEKKYAREKRRKMDTTNPSKPPRPPTGPSLDAADQKYVREIAELARRKRARIERMKALKKRKAAKVLSSSNSSISAVVVTILFFSIIIYQGLFSKSNAPNTSSDPSFGGSEDLISLYPNNHSGYQRSRLASSSLNFAKGEVSRQDTKKKLV